MDALTSIQTVLSTMEFNAERDVRTVKMIKDAVDMQGDMALKLIDSAVIDPDVGQHLDIQA